MIRNQRVFAVFRLRQSLVHLHSIRSIVFHISVTQADAANQSRTTSKSETGPKDRVPVAVLSLNFHFLLLQCQRFTLSRERVSFPKEKLWEKTYSDTLPDIGDVLGYGFKVRRGVVTLGDENVIVVA